MTSSSPDDALVARRRALLRQEIRRTSQADVARRAEKPDRQIGDMAEGRKAFGDSIAREIGPKLRPDLPRDWLIFADEYLLEIDNVSQFEILAQTRRESAIQSIIRLLRATNDSGLAQVNVQAEFAAKQHPLINQPKSSP